MRKRSLLIILLLVIIFIQLALWFASTVGAQTASAPINLEFTAFDLQSPCRVVVQFIYTQNVTVQVSTLGSSLYNVTTGPTQVGFATDAYDFFTVFIHILYNVTVAQTITVGYFEERRAPKGIPIPVEATDFTVTFQFSAIKAPSYPTADEISDKMWERWQNELLLFEANQNKLVDQMTNTVAVVGALAVISFVVCVVLMLVVLHTHHEVAAVKEWGLRHKEEHWEVKQGA